MNNEILFKTLERHFLYTPVDYFRINFALHDGDQLNPTTFLKAIPVSLRDMQSFPQIFCLSMNTCGISFKKGLHKESITLFLESTAY